MKGLQPGQQYHYKVGDPTKADGEPMSQTAPPHVSTCTFEHARLVAIQSDHRYGAYRRSCCEGMISQNEKPGAACAPDAANPVEPIALPAQASARCCRLCCRPRRVPAPRPTPSAWAWCRTSARRSTAQPRWNTCWCASEHGIILSSMQPADTRAPYLVMSAKKYQCSLQACMLGHGRGCCSVGE